MKNYLPEVYEEIIDIQELISTEQVEVDNLKTELNNCLFETFTDDMSLLGITRWETILNQIPSLGQTLDDRRNVVKTRLYVRNKVNFDYINSVVSAYGTVYSVSFDAVSSTASIRFRDLTNVEDVQDKLRELIPAHLLIDFAYNYTRISEVQALTIDEMQLTALEEFSPFTQQP